jgi:pimeloyl-ACP methyl ester carboxylesterase
MDEADFETAHIAGNSLGGYLALKLAERGRADGVVALAPAGGWARGDESYRELLDLQANLLEQARAVAPHVVDARLAHQMIGVARCTAGTALIEQALSGGWSLDPEAIRCPVRVVWGTADRLLPWPSAAARYRDEWLPHADWVLLDDVGHGLQLDVPLEIAALILDFA